MKDFLKIKTNVEIVLITPNGKGRKSRTHNTMTTAGKNGIAAQLLASPNLNSVTHMAIGSGTPAANALGAEIAASRTAFTSKTRTNNIITMVTTFDAGVGTNGAVIEAGLFDASSAGNMWASTTFTAKNKGADDILIITWTITIS